MVGLPARGKTTIARRIARYLRWLGFHARVFNVGNYRRERLGAQQPHDFFDPTNPDGLAGRRAMAEAAMDDLVNWFDVDGGQVAIYDATNSTIARRTLVWDRFTAAGIEVLYIESICDDDDVVARNVLDTKLRSPDYAGVDAEAAVADFRQRIQHYERAYEPIDSDHVSYIKVIDVGRQLVVNRINGYVQGRLVSFLMNLHIEPRRIFLTRHGESQFNTVGRLGGDSDITTAGQTYARALAIKVNELVPPGLPLRVATSTLRRTASTAAPLGRATETWRALDEIEAGVCDGMTYAEIEEKYPDDFAARKADKLHYRYRRGESYEDLIDRTEPVIIELERQRGDVLVVSHQAVLRCLYAYFTGHSAKQLPHLPMPLHTLIELVPHAYGCDERRWELAPGAPNSGLVPGSGLR